jgi:mannose-6-phosphate isomerase-like protein (cupin superfamily)
MTPNPVLRCLLAVPALLVSIAAPLGAEVPAISTGSILEEYVADFREDPSAKGPVTFGISISGEGGGDWHVVVARRNEGDELASVELREGAAPEPTFRYLTDAATLARLHRGELNALTAMARARMSDAVPMDIDTMEGFAPDGDFVAVVLPLTFHFWTRGVPEIVPFGDKSLTREVHGGNASIFYYQPGFRSGWFQIENGQHVNAEPRDQVNPFPSMLVITRGRTEAKIGGRQLTLHAKQTVLIPAGVSHEFWNPYDEPAEGILLMFGEGA